MAERAALRRATLLKWALVLLGAVALTWLAVGVTLTLTIGRVNPRLALTWWPWGAQSKAALANQIVADPKATPAQLAQAERLAREALAREPVNVDAVRALALLHARRGDNEGADRLFAYSEKLSRRDLATQMWMIEKAVRADDIPRALIHYDRALRTSAQAAPIMLPTLVKAAEDPAIAAPLARLLAPRPAWWPQFMAVAIRDIGKPAMLVPFADALELRLDNPHERILVQAMIARLVAAGEPATAYRYYARLTGLPATSIAGLRNGGFEREPDAFAFDWKLVNQPDLSATREPSSQGGLHLVLRASGGQGGEVASQLLLLAPGSYRLTGTIGAAAPDPLDRPSLIIRCGKTELTRTRLPQAPDTGTPFALALTIPPNCPTQTLAITMPASENNTPWIDGMNITRE